MAKARLSQLKEALQKRQFVRFSRRFKEPPIRGYVLDIGPTFFLIALVSDRLWFDGFECFRVNDVGEVKEDPYNGFAECALRKRRERMPKKPRVSVASIEELLLSAGRAFPLVTIHREKVDPDVCWIGRILGIEHGRVSLLEINPDAKWDDKPNTYRLNEITRVNFGGDYEDALHLVGGSKNTGDRKNSKGTNKTDAGKSPNGICRVIDASGSPSPDPGCPAKQPNSLR